MECNETYFSPVTNSRPLENVLSPKQQSIINDFFFLTIIPFSSQEIHPCKSSTLPLPVASECILLQDI